MPVGDLKRLAALIKQERTALLSRWRQQVRGLPSAANLSTPTLNDHIPDLLDELAAAFETRSDESITHALLEGSPPAHGVQRFEDGFDIAEVVAEYNILRDCIHDLAHANGLNLQGQPFHIINRVLDGAIGLAVQTFATHQALRVQQRREDYLAFVAHDLRTPLNAIGLAARILEVTIPDRGSKSEQQQMLHSLRRNVNHLEALVAKVLEENTNLETETGIKLQWRVIDLWPLVEAVLHDLHPVAATSSTQLINNVPDDLVVYADASLLRRVFQNLIANAIKYTPRGIVTIAAQGGDGGVPVECSVSDNGAGIPAGLLETIFEKGETDPGKDGGAGLGLAIVKTFISAHGGVVSVESQEGVGSKFQFTLPARDSGAQPATRPAAPR